MLFIAEPYRSLFTELGLRSVEAMSQFFLGAMTFEKEKVVVLPATLQRANVGELNVFYKQYEYPRPAWSFIGRRSKARCEFENYAVFHRLAVPAAEALAMGEERDALGRLRRACIVTRAIPQAVTLLEFFQKQAADRSDDTIRRARRDVICRLAAMTRTIHRAGFFHHDLFWRNILVTGQATGSPALWWIDCPRGGFVRWPLSVRRRQVKDLASLDKSAGRWCTRGERALFIREYLGLRRLDPRARSLIVRALDYRKHRWPEDWRG